MIVYVRPSHGAWCGGRTIPLACRYCGQAIFWFSCNCGCSILFDELGGGWPHHRCHGYLANLDPTRSDLSTVQQTRLLAGFQIAEDFELEYAAFTNYSPGRSTDIRTVEPEGHEVSLLGIVTDVVAQPDRLARYHGLADSALARGDYRRIFGPGVVQMTALAHLEGGGRESYTFLVRSSLGQARIKRGDLVTVSLRSDRIGLHSVWHAEKLERMF